MPGTIQNLFHLCRLHSGSCNRRIPAFLGPRTFSTSFCRKKDQEIHKPVSNDSDNLEEEIVEERSIPDPMDAFRKPLVVGETVYYPFYHFPQIVPLAFFARLKLYQTLFTTVAVPVCFMAYTNGSASVDFLILAAGVNAFAFVSLAVMSHLFRRWIGRMYLSEDETEVLISHLTFWGLRRNVTIPLTEIEPIEDPKEAANEVFIHLRRLDNLREYYLWNLKHGWILDGAKFEKVFGCPPPKTV